MVRESSITGELQDYYEKFSAFSRPGICRPKQCHFACNVVMLTLPDPVFFPLAKNCGDLAPCVCCIF